MCEQNTSGNALEASDEEIGAPGLKGRWKLESLGSETEGEPAFWIEFGDEGKLSGESLLHSLTGRYLVEGEALRGENIEIERKACFRRAADHDEFAFLRAIEHMSGFSLVDEGSLTLIYGANGNSLRFSRWPE